MYIHIHICVYVQIILDIKKRNWKETEVTINMNYWQQSTIESSATRCVHTITYFGLCIENEFFVFVVVFLCEWLIIKLLTHRFGTKNISACVLFVCCLIFTQDSGQKQMENKNHWWRNHFQIQTTKNTMILLDCQQIRPNAEYI